MSEACFQNYEVLVIMHDQICGTSSWVANGCLYWTLFEKVGYHHKTTPHGISSNFLLPLTLLNNNLAWN